MSICLKHKKEVAGISDMKVLAEMIGDLHYGTLTELLSNLEQKITKDGKGHVLAGRIDLGLCLTNLAVEIWSASKYAEGACEISKPFMKDDCINASEVIPPMTHAYGKYWDQPALKNIEISNSHAQMSNTDFKKLADYSLTDPTGVYEGKMWKSEQNGKWYLKWWGKSENPDKCSFHYREIIVILTKNEISKEVPFCICDDFCLGTYHKDRRCKQLK